MNATTQAATARKKTTEALNSAREAIDQNVESIRETVTDASEKARSQVRGAAKKGVERAEESWNKLQESTSNAVDRSASTMGDHPFATAAIAGSLGFLIGALMFRPGDR